MTIVLNGEQKFYKDLFFLKGAIDMDQFRKDILKEDEEQHKKKVETSDQAKGYRPTENNKESGSKWQVLDNNL